MADEPEVVIAEPAVEEEEEYDATWVYSRPQIEEAPPPPVVAPPVEQPPYTPPWEPKYTGEELFEKPSEMIDKHLASRLQPFAQAILDSLSRLEKAERRLSEPPKPHKAMVDRAYDDVAKSVKETIDHWKASDPAFGDKKVRGRVEAFLKTSLSEGYKNALTGKFEDLESLKNRNLLAATFEYVKAEAGYKGQDHVEVPGANLQGTKPRQAKKSRPDIDPDTLDALKKTGVSPEAYLKELEESEKWNRR